MYIYGIDFLMEICFMKRIFELIRKRGICAVGLSAGALMVNLWSCGWGDVEGCNMYSEDYNECKQSKLSSMQELSSSEVLSSSGGISSSLPLSSSQVLPSSSGVYPSSSGVSPSSSSYTVYSSSGEVVSSSSQISSSSNPIYSSSGEIVSSSSTVNPSSSSSYTIYSSSGEVVSSSSEMPPSSSSVISSSSSEIASSSSGNGLCKICTATGVYGPLGPGRTIVDLDISTRNCKRAGGGERVDTLFIELPDRRIIHDIIAGDPPSPLCPTSGYSRQLPGSIVGALTIRDWECSADLCK